MAKHVIVISEDALVFEDLETLRRTPNFSKFWDLSAKIEKVRSIYPSLTYPAHTTMRTGVYPERHGITNNEQSVLCEVDSKWEFFNDAVCAPDIFDACKENGLSTAAVFWPVTGNHQSIDYLINEYWPQMPGETAAECFLHSGSSSEVIRKVVEPNLHLLEHRIHPYCDAFIHACACSIIREFQPNLLMIHPANIDAYRHQTGLFSDLVTHGLHEIDLWLGDIIKAAHDASIFEQTDFFIVSDHGQLNITRKSAPNAEFRRRKLIETDHQGRITSYQAFCKSMGMSAQVFMKPSFSPEEYHEVHAALKEMCNSGLFGISRVYTKEEARAEEKLAGDFSFVIETDGSTAFINDWNGPAIRAFLHENLCLGKAAHGHHPDKGPQPTFFAFGPDIQPGTTLKNGLLVDEAPTFAHALGISMKKTDGKVIRGIFSPGRAD